MWIRFQFWFWSMLPTCVVRFIFKVLRWDKDPVVIALAKSFCRAIKERQEAKTNEPTKDTDRPSGG